MTKGIRYEILYYYLNNFDKKKVQQNIILIFKNHSF